VELNLYRIVQELVSNIIKHAQAAEITIQLNRHANDLTLTVEDNGIGFEQEKVRGKKGVGLSTMQSRVGSLNGRVYIDSQPGRGTTVTVEIPLI
jgi:signal transduction histidine kinase